MCVGAVLGLGAVLMAFDDGKLGGDGIMTGFRIPFAMGGLVFALLLIFVGWRLFAWSRRDGASTA